MSHLLTWAMKCSPSPRCHLPAHSQEGRAPVSVGAPAWGPSTGPGPSQAAPTMRQPHHIKPLCLPLTLTLWPGTLSPTRPDFSVTLGGWLSLSDSVCKNGATAILTQVAPFS